MKQGDKVKCASALGMNGTCTILKMVSDDIARIQDSSGKIQTVNKSWLTPIKKPNLFKPAKNIAIRRRP